MVSSPRVLSASPKKRAGQRIGATKNAPSVAEIEARRAKVASLLAAHTPRGRISEIVGVDVRTVARDIAAVKAESRERAGASMDQHFADELAYLDELGRRLWEDHLFTDPIDLHAFALALKLSAQRCKLLGLDGREAIEVTGAGGQPLIPLRDNDALLDEIDRMTERLASMPDRLHGPRTAPS